MSYDFLAANSDKINILNYLFENTDLQVFDSYSEYGQEICQYRGATEIAAKFALENGGHFAVTFQLWSPSAESRKLGNKISTGSPSPFSERGSGGEAFRLRR